MYFGEHRLRPEFIESTYHLYKATKDPYYLEVGKHVLENLQEHSRVDCGFASIKVRPTLKYKWKNAGLIKS